MIERVKKAFAEDKQVWLDIDPVAKLQTWYVNHPRPTHPVNIHPTLWAIHYKTGSIVLVGITIDGNHLHKTSLNAEDGKVRYQLTTLTTQPVLPIIFCDTAENGEVIASLKMVTVPSQRFLKGLNHVIQDLTTAHVVQSHNWEKTLASWERNEPGLTVDELWAKG